MALLALACLLILAFGIHGIMMMAAVPAMRAAAASVGFTVTGYRYIGALELAGATGVATGLVIPAAGVAAGTGLATLMLAAVGVHLRNGDPPLRMAPAIGLGLLAGLYVLMLL